MSTTKGSGVQGGSGSEAAQAALPGAAKPAAARGPKSPEIVRFGGVAPVSAGSAEARTTDLIRRTPKLQAELLERAQKGELKDLEHLGVTPEEFAAFIEGKRTGGFESTRGGQETPRQRGLEAIVRKFGRPVLLVQNGTYAEPDSPTVKAQLLPHRARIDAGIARVGRVEFLNHAMSWAGTGWIVARNIVVTNRHVAEIVAESNGKGGFRFRLSPAGVPFGAKLDFLEEFDASAPAREVVLKKVRFIARADQPDIALLEIDPDGDLPAPIELLSKAGVSGQRVAVIGYPAYDSRNDREDIARYFGDIFDVKRLAPGEITQVAGQQHFFMHDATTLGGNSGSVVLDLESGKPLGLHFAGTYLVGNYAVTAEQIKKALKGLTATVAVPESLVGTAEKADGTHEARHFAGRKGYAAGFLGTGRLKVPLPGLGKWNADAAEGTDARGKKSKVLNYQHFSVVYSKSRRMPIFTAVNINGAKAKKIKRADDQWFFDLRLPREIQLTRDDYGHPEIDRGHMVRREDPNWGTMALAKVANFDTFHYTNAAPQHARLNQGKAQWLGLEEYVLSNAKTHGLSITVFTGPVLRRTDPELDNGVAVPEEFWKIVVAIDAETRKLRTTGYVLSQGRLIEDITETFVFGQYRTYQVTVKKIQEATGLDFGALVAADALAQSGLESVPGQAPVVALDRLEDMVL